MPDSNKIILLLFFGHCLINGTLAIIMLIKSYRTDAKNRKYHQANADTRSTEE